MEYFDIVDKNDLVIGKVSEENSKMIPPNQLRFINIIITNNDKILVPKRSSNRKIFPNCYDFSVGGHVNSGEDYINAAYRELKEELGISDCILNEKLYLTPYNSESKTFQKVYMLEYNDDINNYDKGGIEKLFWFTVEEIKEMISVEPENFKDDYIVVIDELSRTSPKFAWSSKKK